MTNQEHIDHIREQRARYQRTLILAGDGLARLRDECRHLNVTREHGSNTGGYDGPDFNKYWCTYTCEDCGCRKTFDSEHPDYEKGIAKP